LTTAWPHADPERLMDAARQNCWGHRDGGAPKGGWLSAHGRQGCQSGQFPFLIHSHMLRHRVRDGEDETTLHS
jgi:hypothetical protein